MTDKSSRRLQPYSSKASEMLDSPQKVQSLLVRSIKKLGGAGGGKLSEMRQQVMLGVALVKAWLAGDYREVPTKTIVSIVGALLYFVMPFDAVPDFLFGWGLLDDAAVLTYVLKQVQEEIEKYKAWCEVEATLADEHAPSDFRTSKSASMNTDPADSEKTR